SWPVVSMGNLSRSMRSADASAHRRPKTAGCNRKAHVRTCCPNSRTVCTTPQSVRVSERQMGRVALTGFGRRGRGCLRTAADVLGDRRRVTCILLEPILDLSHADPQHFG